MFVVACDDMNNMKIILLFFKKEPYLIFSVCQKVGVNMINEIYQLSA